MKQRREAMARKMTEARQKTERSVKWHQRWLNDHMCGPNLLRHCQLM
jgi:hypothetical protein